MKDIEKKTAVSAEEFTEIDKEPKVRLPEEKDLAPIVKEKLSKTAYIGTSFSLDYPKIRGEFFSKVPQKEKREGGYTEGTLSALCLAIHIQLSQDTDATGRANKLKSRKYLYGKALQKEEYIPLTMSLKKAIEAGYGTTEDGGYRHREEIVGLIAALDKTHLSILNSKGDGSYTFLCKDLGGKIKKHKKAILKLLINEKFCDLANGFGALLEDTMKKLTAEAKRGENTEIDRELLYVFLHQDHSKPHTESIDNLFSLIGKYDELKKNKKRAVTSLIKSLDRLKKIGIIRNYVFDENYNFIIYFYSSKQGALPLS